MGQFSNSVATHPRTNEVEVPPHPPENCVLNVDTEWCPLLNFLPSGELLIV